jgi:osmotically-inducible protein OsmY
MADRNTTWDRERNPERDDWQREEAWRRDRESGGSGERYREPSGSSDRPEERRPHSEMGRSGGAGYGRRGQYLPRGDYGPSAFNPSGGRDQELFGTGSRGYGTTWGGSGVYSEGRNLYQGDERNYQSDQDRYQGGQGSYYEGGYPGGQRYQGEQQRNMMQGRHTGKGPKGYRRSDERIREDVCDALTQHGHIDASEIEIRVKDGEVTLTGTVERREEKRMAEDAVEQVPGVREVHNQLRATGNPGNAQTPGNGQHTSGEQHLETSGAVNRRR